MDLRQTFLPDFIRAIGVVKGYDAYDVFQQKAADAGIPENTDCSGLGSEEKAALLLLYQDCVATPVKSTGE